MFVEQKAWKTDFNGEITAATAADIKIIFRSMERLFIKRCLRNKNYSKTANLFYDFYPCRGCCLSC